MRHCQLFTFLPISRLSKNKSLLTGNISCRCLRHGSTSDIARTRRTAIRPDEPILRSGTARAVARIPRYAEYLDIVREEESSGHSSFAAREEAILERALGPFSETDQDVRSQQEDKQLTPADVFRRCVNEGTSNLRVVSMCLQRQKSELDRVPRAKRKRILEDMREQGLARAGLAYLWSDVNLWLPFLLIGRRETLPLLVFAVNEGLIEVIEKWLEVDVRSEGLFEYAGNLWRGALLRQLIMAIAYLDTDLCADGMINVLLNTQSKIHRARAEYDSTKAERRVSDQPMVASVGLSAGLLSAYMELCRDMFSPRGWHNTDPDLYDAFTGLFARSMKCSNEELELKLARLELCHPKSPSNSHALKILEDYVAGRPSALTCVFADAPRAGPFTKRVAVGRTFIERAADVSDYIGDSDKAVWIRGEVMKKYEAEYGAKTHNRR